VKKQHTSTATSILTTKSTYRRLSAQRVSERTVYILYNFLLKVSILPSLGSVATGGCTTRPLVASSLCFHTRHRYLFVNFKFVVCNTDPIAKSHNPTHLKPFDLSLEFFIEDMNFVTDDRWPVKLTLMFCWPCTILYQYSKTNMMHFLFTLLKIKGLYMFRALLAYPQNSALGTLRACYVSCLLPMMSK
jgi:hypothetical protein